MNTHTTNNRTRSKSSTEGLTALYCRLSKDDEIKGDIAK